MTERPTSHCNGWRPRCVYDHFIARDKCADLSWSRSPLHGDAHFNTQWQPVGAYQHNLLGRGFQVSFSIARPKGHCIRHSARSPTHPYVRRPSCASWRSCFWSCTSEARSTGRPDRRGCQ